MKRILFVCVENAGRSQMAEAFFNHIGPAGMEAISAGTNPASSVNPTVVKLMREVGLDLSSKRPKLVSLEMIQKADKIVTMGCGAESFCPAKYLPKVEDWQLSDPKGKSVEEVTEIRDEIKRRVEKLIAQLSG